MLLFTVAVAGPPPNALIRGTETPASVASVAEPRSRLWVPKCFDERLRELIVYLSIFCSFGLVSSEPSLNIASDLLACRLLQCSEETH